MPIDGLSTMVRPRLDKSIEANRNTLHHLLNQDIHYIPQEVSRSPSSPSTLAPLAPSPAQAPALSLEPSKPPAILAQAPALSLEPSKPPAILAQAPLFSARHQLAHPYYQDLSSTVGARPCLAVDTLHLPRGVRRTRVPPLRTGRTPLRTCRSPRHFTLPVLLEDPAPERLEIDRVQEKKRRTGRGWVRLCKLSCGVVLITNLVFVIIVAGVVFNRGDRFFS